MTEIANFNAIKGNHQELHKTREFRWYRWKGNGMSEILLSEAEKLLLQEALLLLGGQGVADDEFISHADLLLLLLLSHFAVQPHAHGQKPLIPEIKPGIGIRFPFSALSRSAPVRFVQEFEGFLPFLLLRVCERNVQ
jgi:hypothetical protein